MAPKMKPRTLNKRFSILKEASPEKDGFNSIEQNQHEESDYENEMSDSDASSYRKYSLQSPSFASNGGCLSELKKIGFNGQARAVGKRTPRVPVNSNRKDDWGNHVSPNKRRMESAFDANDDEVATFALTKAAHMRGIMVFKCFASCFAISLLLLAILLLQKIM